MMQSTRRNFLKFCGGAAAGVIISPLPWKALDDAAIWTQNWSWIARPLKGPVSWSHTTCTLCPAGCGLRLRQVGVSPVSACAIPGHPVSDGCVCPAGLGFAQMRFHPARIQSARIRVTTDTSGTGWRPVGLDAAVADVGRALRRMQDRGAADRVGILDLRPGRSMSVLYREFLDRIGGGRYLSIPDGRDLAGAVLSDLVPGLEKVAGYDFTRADAVVGFGTPLLDGWCGAGPAAGVLQRTGSGPHRIQIESNASATASLADRWISLEPGTELTLALGLARVLLRDGLVDPARLARFTDLETGTGPGYRDLVDTFTPERVAQITGCAPRILRETAHDLAGRRAAVVVGGGDPGGGPLGREEETALWGLNLLLGSVGDSGGVTLRRDLAGVLSDAGNVPVESLRDLPDGSLDVLIVDGSIPGDAIPRDLLRRKLAGKESLLVGLSAYLGGPAAGADIILPVPAPGEWTDDVPSRALAARTSYAVAVATSRPPASVPHPADLLDRIAIAARATAPSRPGAQRHADELRRRADALHAGGIGEVFRPDEDRPTAVSHVVTPDRFSALMNEGCCWSESATGGLGDREIRLLGEDRSFAADLQDLVEGRRPIPVDSSSSDFPLILTPFGRQGLSGAGVLPPVVNKLYRESHLQPEGGRAHLNPETAAALALRDQGRASLVTPSGSMIVTIVLDAAIRPGVVRVATGPGPASLGDPDAGETDVLSICEAASRHVWRVNCATLREV